MEEFSLHLIDYFNFLLQKYGAWGLGISMFAESIGVPFSSTFFIMTAWTLLSKGKLSIWQIVGIATLGITLGSTISYAAGYYSKRLGKVLWLRLHKQHHLAIDYQQSELPSVKRNQRLNKINKYIKKYGLLSVLLAQLFGFTRTFISFPAGLLEINFLHFLIFTAVGGAAFSFLAILGSMILTKFMSYLVSYSYILFFLIIAVAIAGIIIYIKFLLRSSESGLKSQTNLQDPDGEQEESSYPPS
ncbi:MAG: DedA family protein [Bacillota bacterium]|nr:DedA family protein [Bacillota bacterium]